MSCPDDGTLVRLLDAELDADSRRALEAHVDGCPACQALMAALARVAAMSGGARQQATPDGESPLAPGDLVSQYRIVRLEGRGGMGEVYLARDTRLGRRVALKVLAPRLWDSPEERERLLLEAQTTARFAHPHIVTLYEVGEHRGRPFLALEYLDGQTLRQRLAEGTPGQREAARLALAIASALAEAHANDVAHGDLKPENILIPRDGRLRVVDFGLAWVGHGEGASGSSPGGTPAYLAPERRAGAPPSPASDVWALGLILCELATSEPPAREVWPLPAGLPPGLRGLVEACLAVAPARRPDAAELVARLEGLLRAGDAPAGAPFRGLTAFAEEHAAHFCGREDEVAAFVERLRHAPVLPVVGPSGTGKSSLVQAGVIPRLREQARWTVIVLQPGRDPLRALQAAVLEACGESAPPGADRLAEEPERLGLLLLDLAARRGGRVLLVVDQLEEAFTLVEDAATRERFVSAVCSAADEASDPVRVTLTLREDFLGQLARLPAGRQALTQVMVLAPPAARALEQILTRPLQLAGYRFEEPTLAREMVASVAGEVACLPLLQFAGEQLWQRRDEARRVITRASYLELGGVAGALARHADGVLAALPDDEVRLARELLLRLVTGQGLRRVLTRRQLLEGLAPAAGGVLARLTAARLVTARRGEGEDAELQLAHEALLAAWDRLRRWVDEERGERRLLEELEQAAELWSRRGQREDELWQGDALAEAQRALDHGVSCPAAVRCFVEAGRRRQRRRLWRGRSLLAAAFAGLALIAGFLAYKEREASRQRERAEHERGAAELTSAREALASEDMVHARAALRGAFEAEDSPLARTLWWRLAQHPLRWRLRLGDDIFAVDASPRGELIAVGCGDHDVYLIDARTSAVRRVLHGHHDQLGAVAFSPDGDLLASSGLDGAIWLWQVARGAGRPLQVPAGPRGGTDRGGALLAFSPDGAWLAAGRRDGSVQLWRLPSGEPAGALRGHRGAVHVLAFDRRGRLASGGADGSVVLWAADRSLERRLEAHRAEVVGLSFAPDGLTLASGGLDRSVRLWSREGRLLEELRGDQPAYAVRHSPDGRTLVIGGQEHVLRVFDLASHRVIARLTGHSSTITGAAFLPDGTLVTGSLDRTVRLQEPREPPQRPAPASHATRVHGVSFSPDGHLLATASEDRSARVWDVAAGAPRLVLSGHTDTVWETAFSPDGKTLATSSGDRSVRLWDVATGEELARLSGLGGPAYGLDFSSDGKLLAAGSVDRTVRVWDVAARRELQRLTGHTGRVYGLRFSRDAARLASGGLDGSLRIWRTQGWTAERTLAAGPALYGVDFSPDGRSLVTGGADGAVRLWDLARGDQRVLAQLPARAYYLAFHPDGRRVGVPASDGLGRIYPLAGGAPQLLGRHHGEANFLRFSRDGRLAVTTGDDGTVRLWDVQRSRPAWWARGLEEPLEVISHRDRLASSPRWREALAGARLAARHRGSLCLLDARGLELWEPEADRRLWRQPLAPRPDGDDSGGDDRLLTRGGCVLLQRGRVTRHEAPGRARVLVERGATALAADGAEEKVLVGVGEQVLEVSLAGQRLRTYPASRPVTAIASVEGGLALGYSDGTIEVLRTDGGRGVPAGSLAGAPTAPVRHLALGPMDTIAVGWGSGHVGLWDLLTGERLLHTRLHGAITSLAREGARVLAVSELGGEQRWDLGYLSADYCALLREVWARVPVRWRDGRAVLREPPPRHRCAPSPR